MVEKQYICNSCKIRIVNLQGSTEFKCPSCGKSGIVRCKHCRELGARYKCPNCDFTGPN